ncbi:beta-lactamase domain-containing protein [Trypanosoma grayi]|uniref:beta-lactamase domain-containing protein n=1 Tax=Trypanosoma grayi TaxID=71804 RepID=UPI0004F4251E|nr:beta-lactamase domain-containing protein [Trypanosoma grayi]KEG14365.1 beta-lactamase domain-containing protein [Trypanosoma grayi]
MQEDAGQGKKCPPAHAAHALQKRNRTCFRAVVIEVAGALDDPVCQDVTRRLRQYRNRYAPILRMMATLVAPAVSEVELFGHAGRDTDAAAAAVAGGGGDRDAKDGVRDVKKQEEGSSRPEKKSRIEPLITAPSAAVVAGGSVTVVHRLHEGLATSATAQMEMFMAYHFIPLALLHNRRADIAAETAPFVLRHYVHEATRTASFLVADLTERTAVIIDPQVDTSMYEADLATLNLRLVGVVLTHCFVDIAMGHAALLQQHPTALLLSGAPWAPGGDLPSEAWPVLSLSPRLQLRGIPIPSFSPECVVVELLLDSALLALFTGTVIGTDAVPRYEFYADYPWPSLSLGNESPVVVAQRFLKERLWSRYFAPTADGSGDDARALDHVIIFPSHGGYSNVTHQLDLYWAAHVGDLKRMKHSRMVLDKLLDADAYTTHVHERPPLPKPVLMSHVREWNILSVPSAFGGSGARLIASRSLTSSVGAAASAAVMPIVVDIRDTAEHEAVHLKGSVNVPMSFPADAYGVKKAELWLQCILRPRQPVIVLCANEQQLSLVRQRLALISPGATIEAFTTKDLQAPSTLPFAYSTGEQTHGGGDSSSTIKTTTTTSFPLSTVSDYLPRQLVWVVDAAAAAAQRRVDTYQKLHDIEPTEGTLVLDCRTAYEFKNGSHRHSVHIPLADLCEMTALDEVPPASKDTNEDGARAGDFYGPSPHLGHVLLEKLYESSLAAGIRCRPLCRGIERIIVYCAGGYRSLIAASILRRAFEAAAVSMEVRDVAGGALQIMKQRPDLWTVKDRSIICIS